MGPISPLGAISVEISGAFCCWPSERWRLPRLRLAWSRTGSCPICRGRRVLRSVPSSRRPTRSPQQSTAPRINGQGLFFYGYQWWLGRSLIEGREIDWIAGVGLGGQRLYIVPDRDLVVAVTAGLYSRRLQDQVGFTVLNRYVLPANAH